MKQLLVNDVKGIVANLYTAISQKLLLVEKTDFQCTEKIQELQRANTAQQHP